MFKVLKKVLTNETISRTEAEKVSDFLLRRWLSGDNRLIELSNTLNLLPGKQDNYLILLGIQKALKGQIKFIKFPSKSKDQVNLEEYSDMLCQFFRISPQESLEYLTFFKQHCPDELETIKQICRDL